MYISDTCSCRRSPFSQPPAPERITRQRLHSPPPSEQLIMTYINNDDSLRFLNSEPDVDENDSLAALLRQAEIEGWQQRIRAQSGTESWTLQAASSQEASAAFIHLLKSLMSGISVARYRPESRSITCSITAPRALLNRDRSCRM